MGSLTQLATSVATIYTVTAPKTKGVIKQILVANTSTSTASVTLHIVGVAGTATAANKIVSEVSVAANSTVTLDITQVLNVGETIQALASAATSINLMISGYEVE
jgi:hypothetical protein